MSITRLAGSSYALQRLSPYVLDPVVAISGGHVPDRQPPVASCVQVRTQGAGTVTVSGTVEGASASEVLTFTTTGFRVTARRFSAVAGIVPAGALLGSQMDARAVGADGSPQAMLLSSVATSLPGAFTPGTPRWAPRRDAQVEARSAMIAFDWRQDIEPRRADYLLDEQTGERWKVEGVNLLRGGVMPHHWEVWVVLWDGEAPG